MDSSVLANLANLSPADKSKVMQQLKQEVAIQNFQELYTKMVEKCFIKCVIKPGAELDSTEKKCIGLCIDRYTDAWNIISQGYHKIVQNQNR